MSTSKVVILKKDIIWKPVSQVKFMSLIADVIKDSKQSKDKHHLAIPEEDTYRPKISYKKVLTMGLSDFYRLIQKKLHGKEETQPLRILQLSERSVDTVDNDDNDDIQDTGFNKSNVDLDIGSSDQPQILQAESSRIKQLFESKSVKELFKSIAESKGLVKPFQ